MLLVVVPIRKSQFIGTLAAMREWLDGHQCETKLFRTIAIAGGLLLQIGFSNPAPALEFADHFRGTATGIGAGAIRADDAKVLEARHRRGDQRR